MIALGAMTLANAQQALPQPLTQGQDAITFPGIWRIVIVFVAMAALAVGIAAVLRRVLPRFNALPAASGGLRLLNRMSLGGGVRIHVVQYEDATVLLAEGRHGLALTVLNKKQEAA